MRARPDMTHKVLRTLIREILHEDFVPTSPTVNIGDVSNTFRPVTAPNLTAMLAAGAFLSAYPYLSSYLSADCLQQPFYPLAKTQIEFEKYKLAVDAKATAPDAQLTSYVTKLQEEMQHLIGGGSVAFPQYELIKQNMQVTPAWPSTKKTWLDLAGVDGAQDQVVNFITLLLTRMCLMDTTFDEPTFSEKEKITAMINDKIQNYADYVKLVSDFAKSCHDTTTKVLTDHRTYFTPNKSNPNVLLCFNEAGRQMQAENTAYTAIKSIIK